MSIGVTNCYAFRSRQTGNAWENTVVKLAITFASPSQAVQRTRVGRFAQRQIERQRRLAPVPELCAATSKPTDLWLKIRTTKGLEAPAPASQYWDAWPPGLSPAFALWWEWTRARLLAQASVSWQRHLPLALSFTFRFLTERRGHGAKPGVQWAPGSRSASSAPLVPRPWLITDHWLLPLAPCAYFSGRIEVLRWTVPLARLSAWGRGEDGSSSLRTCHWGGCSLRLVGSWPPKSAPS